MKMRFNLLLIMLVATLNYAIAVDTITVDKAGGLGAALEAIDKERITSLAIRGKLNAEDISLLRTGEGKLSVLDTLDISEVTLVPSDEPYYSYRTANDGSFSPNIYRFFISEEERDIAYLGNSLSQANPHYYDHYDPYLSGAFAELSYKRVILPKSIDKIGIRTFWKCKKLEEVVMDKAPVSIGDWAFRDCTNLVEVPDLSQVKTIGEMAFAWCFKLQKTSVGFGIDLSAAEIIPDQAFVSCQALSSVHLSETATSIGYYAFSECKSLTEINIPRSLFRLSWTSFRDTPWLSEHLDIEDGITYLGNVAIEADQSLTSFAFRDGTLGIADDFYHKNKSSVTSLQFPSTLCYIGAKSFKESGLTSIILPDGLEEIGKEAFRNVKIKNVVFPNSLSIIGESAFRESSLENVTIHNHVEEVGGWAFAFVESLQEVFFDSRSVGRNVFQDCNNLKEVTIGSNTTSISIRMFSSCEKLEMVQFGSNINNIEESAFEGCYSLKEISLPNSLRSIGNNAFSDCDSLREVVFPEGLLRIESDYQHGAFLHCDSLTRIVLPSTLQVLGKYSFRGTNLRDVVSYISSPFELDLVFDSKTYYEGTLTVPKGTKEAYCMTAGWKEFSNIIEMGGTESITISSAKQVTYMSDKNLDFTAFPNLKAYVATGYDKASGTIWLTRVKEVPANTGFLLMGEADTYEIPVKAGGLSAYYQNMFKGTIEGTTIQTTDGDYTNYYLSNGDAGVGFYKVQGSVELKPNRAYLSVPTEIPAVGATGSTETIKVSAAGQVPYYNSQSLDFSSLDAQGVKAYTATGYDYSSGTIWLTRVKQVPAETGILIMAPQGEYPVPTASVASVYANMFKGTLTGTTIQTHETIAGEDYINYYLSSGDAGVGFYKVTKEEGVTIGANRCYLPILSKEAAGTRSAGSGQNQITFEEADEVISIPLFRGIGDDNGGTTNLTPALSKGEGEWYTLQGQRVAKPGKGLYIRNGKKVVIK